MGVCALVILVPPALGQSKIGGNELGAKLEHHRSTVKRNQHVLRFFKRHTWLFDDPRFRTEARRQVKLHRRSLIRAQRNVASIRIAIRRSAQRRHLAIRKAPPRSAICTVFGRYCREALAVARCESGLQTTARNGQYRGLFQMGWNERRLFGHGTSAFEQARAAHRYFVRSGRDWSPWTCKPR